MHAAKIADFLDFMAHAGHFLSGLSCGLVGSEDARYSWFSMPMAYYNGAGVLNTDWSRAISKPVQPLVTHRRANGVLLTEDETTQIARFLARVNAQDGLPLGVVMWIPDRDKAGQDEALAWCKMFADVAAKECAALEQDDTAAPTEEA